MGVLASHHSPPASRLQVPASLCVGNLVQPVQVFIDSGAEDSLIDQQLAQHLGCELTTLEKSIPALELNGTEFAQVTHKTSPITLIFSGNHCEVLTFLVITAPQTPLVRGYPWLKKHNPHINWSQGKIIGWSPFCHALGLKSALPPTGGDKQQPVPEPFEPNLSNVPPEYHNLRVFSKEKALSLPPHCLYNCTIDLLPSAPLLSGRLYNLSRPEREAMEKYISDSLAAGIIRPSTSPLGAGFFFLLIRKISPSDPALISGASTILPLRTSTPFPSLTLQAPFEPLTGAKVFTKLRLPLILPWGTLNIWSCRLGSLMLLQFFSASSVMCSETS